MPTKDDFINAITSSPVLTEEELEEVNLIHGASDEERKAIKEVFEYYGIDNECVALFGSWAISANEDIVNISVQCNKYALFSNRPNFKTENEIFEHLGGKNWFDAEQRSNLVDALSYIELKSK